MDKAIIITTINDENEVLRKFASLGDWHLIVVGDRKGPKKLDLPNTTFLDIETQQKLGFNYVNHCPENHYSRKNIGYLFAMKEGAGLIAESDDDNLPNDDWAENITFNSSRTLNNKGFYNIYNLYSDEFIWPRGFPLEEVNSKVEPKFDNSEHEIGAWQFLANNSPDVDAIFRLTRPEDIKFKDFGRVALSTELYCPFNSQNTFWNKKAFHLQYLPISVTFRFTDILRGYVAQRLFWHQNLLLGFGNATVYQERNVHDLMRDFKDEVPMYLNIVKISQLFNEMELPDDPFDAMEETYNILFNNKIVEMSEIDALVAWLKDCKSILT